MVAILTYGIVYAFLFSILLLVLGWSLYNLPILAAGVRDLRRNKRKPSGNSFNGKDLPTFSVIIPVKNEEKVVGRLLNALLRLNYPRDKVEIIVVEDGSTDGTVDICKKYEEESHGVVKLLHKPVSDGKPSALNYGVKNARGEIIGVFDADNVPERNVLMNVCRHYEDSEVAGVQGRTLSINSEENMLSKFASYEEAVWCEAYLRGKDVLDLFVHLKGSCMFVRRDVLEKLGGFDEKTLSEDMEISARLTEKGYKIRYAPDVRSWQETPSSLKQLFTQRTRWYRGTMEVAFKYGRLMAKLSRKSLDAEATLFGPFILIASLTGYLVALYGLFAPLFTDVFWQAVMQLTALATTLTLLTCGFALMYLSKPRRASNLLWLPFVYFYWTLQAFIALYAAMLILFRRPRKWIKTEKTAAIKTYALRLGE
jgi:cellulose synthase/poly-beta-1,6-N-acetylglucosamine synthase-like glycosyltransferase